MEERRLEGGRLLKEGKLSKAEIARQLGVTRASVTAWAKGLEGRHRATGELKWTGTRDLLTTILTEEEGHIDWLEAQKDQIAQMGIQLYLSLQVKE